VASSSLKKHDVEDRVQLDRIRGRDPVVAVKDVEEPDPEAGAPALAGRDPVLSVFAIGTPPSLLTGASPSR
jgi:hypothetical protein